jgi:hypothetical protein
MKSVYILAATLVVAFIAFLGIKITKMISREGFEDIKNNDDYRKIMIANKGQAPLSSFCPNNGTMVQYMTPGPNGPSITSWACYPVGNTDVNSVFQNPPSDKSIKDWNLLIAAPKGSTVTLFSKPGATGEIVGTLSDATDIRNPNFCPSDGICNPGYTLRNVNFASIKVTSASGATPATAPVPVAATVAATASASASTPKPTSTPTPAPVATAATVVGTAAPSTAASVIGSGNEGNFGNSKWSRTSGGLVFSSDSGQNMMNVNCPSGDPKISFVRNTKNAAGGSLI